MDATLIDNPLSTSDLEARLGRYAAPVVEREPEPTYAPAVIPHEQPYVFRSKPGTVALHRIRIPAIPPPAMGEEPRRHEFMTKRYERKYGAHLADFDALADKVGGPYITFTMHDAKIVGDEYGRKTRECSFQTGDPDVAAFVRQAIRNDGRFYEDIQPVLMQVGDRTIPVSVASADERDALLASLAAGTAPEPELPSEPVDKNGKPLKGALLAQWQAKHGGGA